MDKIVVITGGTSGIGFELAKFYRQNNDKVIIISRTAKSNDGMHYACDVSNEELIKAVFSDIQKRFGRVDILINSAGFGASGITQLISLETAKKLFDVNFFGTVICNKYALPLMQKDGKILNVSSAMDLFPLPYRSFYASSKSAVTTLSLAQRMECELLGVTISCILPGDIKTNFTANRIKDLGTTAEYGNKIKTVTEKLDKREDKRMSAVKCAKIIFKISNKKKLKPMYIIGTKYKALYFISRFVPKSWLLWGINKYVN